MCHKSCENREISVTYRCNVNTVLNRTVNATTRKKTVRPGEFAK